MKRIPMLNEQPRSMQILLAGVVPIAFGAITGYFLGVSEVTYLVLTTVAIVGGIGGGYDHLGAAAGAKRGLLGGFLFSASILIAHEIHGADAEADLPDPAILLVPLFMILGAGFGAVGGWLRARSEAGASAA